MDLWPMPPTRTIDTKKYHQRTPDVGLRIWVRIYDPTFHMDFRYSDYGNGQSKTAFMLNGAPNDRLDGKILKLTEKQDREPEVFTELSLRSSGAALEILYNSFGIAHAGNAITAGLRSAQYL